MSNGTKYPIDEVLPIAESLLVRLRSVCTRIEIAGSIRRNFRRIGDIELVCISKPDVPGFGETPQTDAVTRQLRKMLKAGLITRRMWDQRNGKWGPKYKEFRLLTPSMTWTPYKVDLFIVSPPAQWGSVFTIRTGPSQFSKALMGVIKQRGLVQVDGHLETPGGVPVLTPTEESYFKAVGIPWIEPRDRSAQELKRILKTRPVKLYAGIEAGDGQPLEQGRLF